MQDREDDIGSKHGEIQNPVTRKTFFILLTIFLAVVGGVLFAIFRFAIVRNLAVWEWALLVSLVILVSIVALAATKAVPKNSRSFAEWRQPAVMGRFASSVLLVGIPIPATVVGILLGENAEPQQPPSEPPEALFDPQALAGRWCETDALDIAYRLEVIEEAVTFASDGGDLAPFEMTATIRSTLENGVNLNVQSPAQSRGASLDLILEDDGVTRRLLWQDQGQDTAQRYVACD